MAVEKQVIAKVKNIEGEVVAISPDGSKRVLIAGDFIYSDEMIDTSKGKVFLVQDGDIVLQTDIAAILSQGELSPEEKAKIDKILKDLNADDKDMLAKIAKEQLTAASGEAGQDKHEPPVYIPHNPGQDPGVHSQPQVLISFGPPPDAVKTYFTDDTPEQFLPPVITINPIEVRATTLNQLANPNDPDSVADYFGVLGQNNNIVKQDLSLGLDVLLHSHPDAVFAVTVTGNIADYLVSPLEFPSPIILPFGLGMQPWKVVPGDVPNTISYLYRKEDLNLLKAMESKQDLIDAADEHIQHIHEVKTLIEQQISGISNLSLDKFEIKANLNVSFTFFDNLKNQLQLEIGQLNAQKVIANANLTAWENTNHNFGIPLGTISNAAAIMALEANWKVLGGSPETIPELLESLYSQRGVFEHDINHLDTQILADQTLLDGIVQDVITPLLLLTNFNPIDDADFKQALMKASEELDKQDLLAQGYKNALVNSLDSFDLVLRTGLANDADFAFKSQVLLVDDINAVNPVIIGDLFEQNGSLVNVDALASGLKVELNGDLSHDQILTISSVFNAITTKLIFNLDLKFANPSADENIHIEFPGVPGLNLSVTTLNFPFVLFNPNIDQSGQWVLHPDNSVTLDLPSASPNYVSRPSIVDTLELSFPTSLLKNVELNNFNFKILINSQVIPIGDNEADLSNNTLHQEFNFEVGDLPGRGIYFVESVSQADALANVEKHAIVDIKPLLDNISVYLDILSGPAETNFLNNTRIEFKFFNVDPLEPPKVLFNDGVVHSYDFVKVGDSWVLTGQALKDYIDAWNAATPPNKAYYEQPVIIGAPYGAEDILIRVFGLINGANEVVVQDIVPLIIDAVAQEITADDVDLSNVVLNVDFTKFNLKVNIVAPDGDGSESRLVDINLTDVFNYTSDVPLGFNPNWTVFTNNGVWTIDTVSVPGEIHLKGNIAGASGTVSSELILGFSTATLEYLPKNINGNYEIEIGSSTFDTPLPGENLAGVISKEILDSNEQDFNLTDDQAGPVYLKSGTTVEVPASIVLRKEAQVDVADLTPGIDAYSIDISKALVDLYSSLDAAGKVILNSGVIPLPGTNASIDALILNTKILFLENNIESAQFTIAGNALFNKLHDYITAAPVDQAALGKILYYVGQYDAESNDVQVLLTDAGNVPIIIYPDLVGGEILPEKTVIFDAVGSGTEIPNMAAIGVVLGFPTSTLNLTFDVDAKDITTEKVEIIINLPNAPDPAFLKDFAPPGLVFGWTLDPLSDPAWTLTGNVLKGTFDLSTLLTLNVASSLALHFNTVVLTNLDSTVSGSNIFNFGYAIHTIDSDAPNNYIVSDNQSPDITGSFAIDVGNLAGIYLIKELDNTNFDAADAVLPANNQALLVPINDVMVQLFNKINDASYDDQVELALFFASSKITVEISPSTLPITEENLPRVGLNDPNEIILPANATGEDRLIDVDNVTPGTTIISGLLLREIYDAWVASNTDVALRTVPEIAIFGGPFYDNDFKLKVSATIGDILSPLNNQTLDVFNETTIVVDATAWGVEVINSIPQFFVKPDLDWVIDASGFLTGYVDVTYTFDAKFLDLTGLEFHQAILDLSLMPSVDQTSMQIVGQTGTDVAWSKPVAGVGIFTSDAMFSSTLNPDMVGSVTIRFNGATLPADFFDNYGLKTVGLNAVFKIVSTIVPVDQEFITSDNQTTSTFNSPLVAISNGVDEQGALNVIPQIPTNLVVVPSLNTTVDFEAVFIQLQNLYVINGIVTNSTNIKASSVTIETSGIPVTKEIPDVYFNNVLQDVFNPSPVDNAAGKLFSQGGLSSGITYTLTGDELLQVFTAWLNGGDAHVRVQSGIYNSYPFSVSADGVVIQANLIPLKVVGQVDTLVRVDASAEGFVNNTMAIDSKVAFEANEDTGVLTGNAIVEVILKGQLTDIDGSETYRLEIQLPNAVGNQFSLYTGGPAFELHWVSLGGGKFAADINLTAASNEPGFVSPLFFSNAATGEFDTSFKLLIDSDDLAGLTGGQIQLVGVLSAHDNQSVATGSTLTSPFTEITAVNNNYAITLPQVNDSNQVSTTKVNELIWDQEIVKLALQNVNYDQLLPIPIFKEFIEAFKIAVDTEVLFLNSDSLIGRTFTLQLDMIGNNVAWGDTQGYIALYNNGVNTIIPIDLDISHPTALTTRYTADIDGQYLKAIYDAYFNTGTFSEDDINYLTNIFVALPTGFNLNDFTAASLTHIKTGTTDVPNMSITFDPDLVGLPANPAPTFDSTAVDKQAITISIEAALDYLYTQLVSGNSVDSSRLADSSIVVNLKGVDAANSLVYMADPNGGVPAPDPSQVGISPNANNAFIAGSGDINSWSITGTDLVQLFTERFGSTPSNINPADLPDVGIMGQMFLGNDLSVSMDVLLSNSPSPTTTQNIIPETLYIVDDSSHGALVNRIYDEGLSLETVVTYQADSNQDDQFDGPETTGGLIGTVKIEFKVDAGILDVSSGEQHYLVIEMFPSNLIGNDPLNLPEINVSNADSNQLQWVEFETLQGSIFIAKVPAGTQHIDALQSIFTVEMSIEDLRAKGYVIDKDPGQSDIYYSSLNQLAVNFSTDIKLYSTLDMNYIINGYNTGSLNTVSGADGLPGNNSLVNDKANQPLLFNYSSVPVATADDLTNINTTNTFYFNIALVLNAIHDRLEFLGQISNDDIVKESSITITLIGKNGVSPTLAGDADLPDGVGGTKLSTLLENGPTYTLDSDNMLAYYNLWNSQTTTPAEKLLLENWFFPPEVGNDRDFSVQIDYVVGGYQNIVPIEENLLEPHLVIVRAVADSTVDSASLDGLQPIVHTGAVPALPGEPAPANSAFDFNAAEAARFVTQLHVNIQFGEPNPNVIRLVEIFMPKAGSNPDNSTGNIDLGWKVVPGADNGWQIDENYSATQVKLYKLFEPGAVIPPDATGNIDEYLDLSFLMTGVGGFDLRNVGQSAILQYMGLSYQVTTITQNVDFGGGNVADQEDTVVGTVTQDIVVPSFVGVAGLAPAFTNQDDLYFVSNPDSGLSTGRTVTFAIVSGTIDDPDAHYDANLTNYLNVENGTAPFSSLFAVQSGFNPSNPFPYSSTLVDQHTSGPDFLLPSDGNIDPSYAYIRFTWANSGDTHTFSYQYQLNGSVTENGIGRFFEPGEGDDIVIGSYGRDIFHGSQVDFVGGVNTPLLDIGGDPVDLGKDVFVGGLGRDWIESGAGNDIAYSDGMPISNDAYSINYVDFAPVFLSSSIGSASIYMPKITDVIATGAGDDIIYTGGLNYNSLFGTGGGSIDGHDAVGITGKDAGVLVFAGPGDNFIFSGRGADIIVLDDTLGITRIAPTAGGFEVPTGTNLQDGLHYVYNADVAGGNYDSVYTGSGDSSTFSTVSALTLAGNIGTISSNGVNSSNNYLYDIIRPIYESSVDTDLTYGDNTSGATDITFRTAEHGENTLVYWKDSVSSNADSADVVMYFNVNSDKINLTALFEELSPSMSQADRLAAIQLSTITSATPFDSTSSDFATASYDPFSTDGREGTRVSVTINSQTFVVADLADVQNNTIVKANVFEVMAAPDVPQI